MRSNPERRAGLVDAAIEVLASRGARGLTFRSVDEEADVPVGTASNYFRNRDDLLMQAGGRVYERLQPAPGTLEAIVSGPHTRDELAASMREIVERLSEFRSGYLALMELRLESTRRPELQAVLTKQIRADLDQNIEFHRRSGMPGDTTTVELLYLALNWLIIDRLTLPGMFSEEHIHELIELAVDRAVQQ